MSIWRIEAGLCDICNSEIAFGPEYQNARGKAMRLTEGYWQILNERAKAIGQSYEGKAKWPAACLRDQKFARYHEKCKVAVAAWRALDAEENKRLDGLRDAARGQVAVVWPGEFEEYGTAEVALCERHLEQLAAETAGATWYLSHT